MEVVMTAQADELPGVTPAPKPQGVTSGMIREALERHYRKPGAPRDGEVLIPEVSAPGSNRRADLVRVGMWASRGTGIDVHEIKVSRNDWLRELDDPAKAEAWWPYCNRFWVVAPPGIVQVAELPEGWGLLEFPASGRRFKVVVKPATRTDIRLTVPLLVELLRRADNQRLAEMAQLREQHRDDVRRLDEEWRFRKTEGVMSPRTRDRLQLLDDLETALGVPLAEFPSWPRLPVQKVTPAELAAFLADAREHVAASRRSDEAARRADDLRRTAQDVLKELAKLDRAAPS